MSRFRRWSVEVSGSAEFLESDPSARDQLLALMQAHVGREVRGPRGGRYVLGEVESVTERHEFHRDVIVMRARLPARYIRPKRKHMAAEVPG